MNHVLIASSFSCYISYALPKNQKKTHNANTNAQNIITIGSLLSRIKQTNQNTTSQYKNNQISLVASKMLQTVGYKCWFEPKMITSY